jgi:hypothetical protein
VAEYYDIIARYGKPFGIEELGCRDEATFSKVMDLFVENRMPLLRFVNFFDMHVVKEARGVKNPWYLKDADLTLLRRLAEESQLPPSEQ